MTTTVGLVSDPSGASPLRPLTDDPKTNVLYYALLGCTCASFLFIVMTDGAWRWLALAPVGLGVLLFITIIKRARKVRPNRL